MGNRVLGLGTVVFLALTGCGKESAETSAESKDTAKDQSKADKVTKQTIADVFKGSKAPELLGHFKDAKFGMTADELKKVSPAFADKGDFLSDRDFGVQYFAGLEGKPQKKLQSLSITVPEAELKTVEASWGAPVKCKYRRKDALAWFNKEAKIRAIARKDDEGYSVVIEPYLPQEDILGERGKPLGLETDKPLIGSTPDELKAAYPDNFDRALDTLSFMSWPPDEFGDKTSMELSPSKEDGKIGRIQFWLHHGDNDDAKKAALAALEAKYGASSETKSTLGRPQLAFADDPTVRAGETEGAWVIEIKKPRK